MANKIKFIARDRHVEQLLLPPVPSASLIPEWWKSATPYYKEPINPDGKKIIVENTVPNVTFKKCTPMLDTLTVGYTLQLWSDVQIRNNENGDKRITWRPKTNAVFEEHGLTSDLVERPEDCALPVFKYASHYSVRVPKGYSVLVTQPFGYRQTPFTLIPGILDADSELIELALPLWIKKDFEGIVERGTPIAQFIPFKRDDWKLELDRFEDGEYWVLQDRVSALTIVNNYVKHHWKKKSFK